MLSNAALGLCAGLVALAAAPLTASAQDAIAAPAQKTIGQPAKSDMIPLAGGHQLQGASLQGATLTMTGVGSNSIVFADRPFRAAGHVLTKHFLKEWDEGSDSFAEHLLNATISVLSAEGDTVEDAVVVLKSPKLEGDNLTFEVTVLEGGLSKATGPASLFIDWFAARGYGGRGFLAGGYHGGAWHGAWYGHPAGVGVGAAAVGLGAAAAERQPQAPTTIPTRIPTTPRRRRPADIILIALATEITQASALLLAALSKSSLSTSTIAALDTWVALRPTGQEKGATWIANGFVAGSR